MKIYSHISCLIVPTRVPYTCPTPGGTSYQSMEHLWGAVMIWVLGGVTSTVGLYCLALVGYNASVLYGIVVILVAIAVPSSIFVHLLERNQCCGAQVRFSEEQKGALRELMVRTNNKPSDKDIVALLTQRNFAEKKVTRRHIRLWFQQMNSLLNQLLVEAAGEMASFRERGGSAPRGGMARLGCGGIGGTGGNREIIALRGTGITTTTAYGEVTTPTGRVIAVSDNKEATMAIRGGEVAQRHED